MKGSNKNKTNSNKRKPLTEYTKTKIRQKKLKYVYELVSPEGVIFTTDNLSQLCKNNNLNQSNMRFVCHGKYLQHKFWTGRILEELPRTI